MFVHLHFICTVLYTQYSHETQSFSILLDIKVAVSRDFLAYFIMNLTHLGSW